MGDEAELNKTLLTIAREMGVLFRSSKPLRDLVSVHISSESQKLREYPKEVAEESLQENFRGYYTSILH